MTNHKGLPATLLFALVGPLVSVRAHVLLQVGPRGEEFAAAFPVTIERVAVVKPHMGVQAVQRGEGVAAALHLTHEGLFPRVDAHVDLEAV